MSNLPLRPGIVLLGLCVVVALSLGEEGPGDAVDLELTSITPQILPSDEPTEVMITGAGFLPETQLALIGGGVAEVGSLSILNDIRGLAISGDLTYVTGTRLTIIDASQPDAPQLVGQVTLGFLARAVAVQENHAYIAGRSVARLRVVNVSDPSLPVLGPTFSTCVTRRAVTTEGALYLACGDGRLLIGNLADPANPVIAASAPFGTGGKVGMAIQGDRLFVLDALSGLFILGLENPLAPRVMGVEPGARGAGVTVEGDFAYVAGDAEQGLQVVDVRDPVNPTLMGVAPTRHEFDDPAVAGGFVFTGNDKRIWVYDARDSASPAAAYDAGHVATLSDLERSGDVLAVADQGAERLRLFVIGRPESPGLVHQLDGIGAVGSGLLAGQRAYMQRAFPQGPLTFDRSNPHGPRIVGCLSSGHLEDVAGHYAFLATTSQAAGSSLEVWDVGSARSPRKVGFLEVPERISDMAVEEGIAYVGLEFGRVVVVDVSKPSAPAILAIIPPAEEWARASSLSVTGNRLTYLAGDPPWVALRNVNVTDPGAPEPLGALSLPWFVDGGILVVTGDVGYMSVGGRGLHVLDLSDPTAPALSTTITGFEAGGVRLAGGALFVHGPPHLMFDISEPLRPRLSGGITWSGGMAGIADDLAYLGGGHGGLQVVQAPPSQPRPVIEGQDLARLQIPPGLAPGFYHLMALQPDGETVFLHNAVEVRGDPKPQYLTKPSQRDASACPSGDI